MKFNSLSDLIDFEKNLEWFSEDEFNSENFFINSSIKRKAKQLRTRVYGVYEDKVVTVVSEQFKPINVSEIASVCEEVFGKDFEEKSYKEGIVRVYNKSVEDRIGEVKPIVIYPANIGSMSVNIGIHHNAFVCSNGLIISDNFLTRRIIHRASSVDIKRMALDVSNNLELVLKKIDYASNKELSGAEQLAVIIQGLKHKDGLIKKALSDYCPQNNSLWEAIQSITYVARDLKSKGFGYAINAGKYLLNDLETHELVSAAGYLFAKEQQGKLSIDNSAGLYLKASQILGGEL